MADLMDQLVWTVSDDIDETKDPIGLKDLEDGAEVTLFQSIAFFAPCYRKHPDAVVEVWEPADRFYTEDGSAPDLGALPMNRMGCTECQKFVRIEG